MVCGQAPETGDQYDRTMFSAAKPRSVFRTVGSMPVSLKVEYNVNEDMIR